ncbi:putative metalloprotease CJM1_0395 family protein [uncultured Tateyamaria sp.]|uniref:putative metalloprotease CJM1_0395 family protein n=1 Tax=uncultured Tateyamaria sp. TaxID=455651 RepID=UPI00261D2CAB|nr:putative metalloprotease CJM1_0395 family protein [uncultured Tateyamaria sp.]
MDAIDFGQGADWTAVAALIQQRQRDVADRVAAQADPGVAERAGSARADVVRAPERGASARGAVSGEAGLGAGDAVARPDEETDASGLTAPEQAVVKELRARDAEVRRHEQAHAAVGGQYAGAPTYSYQTGPDGRQYAVGGAVSIDVSPVDGDPGATISKMEVVKSAALAPAEPSAADRQVAALADALRAQAVADLAAERSQNVDMRL